MTPRISVITLGVSDMERAIAFYRDGLGLPMRDDKPPVTYFALEGTWIAVFPRDALEQYAGLEPGYFQGRSAVTLSCNVATADDVDRTMVQATAAGATKIQPAKPFNWGGYAGWFGDPDGHLWEIVYNPRPFIE